MNIGEASAVTTLVEHLTATSRRDLRGTEIGAVLASQAETLAADAAAASARHSRDQLVANLVAGGVSMYRVSKVLGVSESGVRKMVDRAS